jgi:type IV secretion system protein VirB3
VEALERTPIFTALTRPQMFVGVTYNYFILNAVIAAELFLIFRSAWVLPAALVVHVAGVILCLREPQLIDLWLLRASRCPRVRKHDRWRCNTYRP